MVARRRDRHSCPSNLPTVAAATAKNGEHYHAGEGRLIFSRIGSPQGLPYI